MRHKLELMISILTFGWLLFVATNVNVTLGQTYLHFTLGAIILLVITLTVYDKRLDITFAKQKGGWLKAIFWGGVGWISLVAISIVVMRFVDPTRASIVGIMSLLQASVPALAASKVANLITFGFAIAYVETQLWARMMEILSDWWKIRITKQNLFRFKIVVLIGALSLAFVLFHLTAKGIANAAALWVVFIMMAISLIMVTIFQETRQAVFLHIWANTIAAYLILFVVGNGIIGGIVT